MRAPGLTIGSARRIAVAVTAVVAFALAACNGDDDATDGTLGVIDPGASTGTGSLVPGPPGSTPPPGTGIDPSAAGSGFVSIGVQITSVGIDETLSLDRSTVAADALDPVTLNAACTPLDGGDTGAGIEVSVVDLARLASGDRLVSAELRYADATPGEHDMTLEVGGAEQVTTTFNGTVTVAADGLSGTFAGADDGGTPVSGTFACSAEEIVTTTTAVPPDAGEVVPDSSPPAGTSTTPTG
jgi:hypothetical protein